jgi:hypothetical protein
MDLPRFVLRPTFVAASLFVLSALPGHAIDKLPPMSGIGAGATSACSVSPQGLVRCWGRNDDAFLDASGTGVLPAAALGGGLTAGVSRLAVGARHRCAIVAGGALKCWGANATGAVGDGTTLDRTAATDVTGLGSGIAAMAAGDGFSCAVTATGGVKCWGRNDHGQLGNGTTTSSATPVDVSGLAGGVIAVAAGADHACAIVAGGALKCWGRNDSGQLGIGSLADNTTPVDVPGLASGVSAVSLGTDHSCAIGSFGALFCWGNGATGKVGDGSSATTPRTAPVNVAGLTTGVTAVSAGATHTCASAGFPLMVKCWGANLNWKPGDPPASQSFATPTDVPGLSNVGVLAAGNGFQCTLAGDGRVKCWGDNAAGQLGTGTLAPAYAPVDVVDQQAFLALTASGTGGGRVLPVPHPAGGTNSGYPITLVAAPDYGSTFTGWGPGACAGVAGTVCPVVTAAPVNESGVTMPGTLAVSAVFDATPAAAGLVLTPATIAFPGAVVGTTGATVAVTLANGSLSTAPIASVTTTGDFSVSATNCDVGLLPATSCAFQVTFSPTGLGPRTGSLQLSLGTFFGSRSVTFTGTGLPGGGAANVSAVIAGYYERILGRAPDAEGAAFWAGEVARMSALGANVSEVFFAMAYAFFNSPDYASGNRSDVQFVTDLYRAFFLREPDAGGLVYWTGHLQAGKPRGAVLNDFLFSGEFSAYMASLFGSAATSRSEVSMVMDFYRGAFDRLPDTYGFNYWVTRFRAAQCRDAAAITREADVITREFIGSPEYAARQAALAPPDRAPAAVVSLYNMVLRRGGDFAGFRFWVDQVNGPGGLDAVRQGFVASPEFQSRVGAVIAEGCAL